jgi:hypothetical protein
MCLEIHPRSNSELLQLEARVHPVGQVKPTPAAGVCNDQVDEPAILRNSYLEPPRLLPKAHYRTFGRQPAIDVHLKPDAGIGRQEPSVGAFALCGDNLSKQILTKNEFTL